MPQRLTIPLIRQCNCGVLIRAQAFGTEGYVFETGTGKAVNLQPTCPMIEYRGQNQLGPMYHVE